MLLLFQNISNEADTLRASNSAKSPTNRAQIISNTITVLTLALPSLLVFINDFYLLVPRHFRGATKSPVRGLLS